MVNASATGYQTAASYQGGQAAYQAAKNAKPSPAAGTQQGNQRAKQELSSDRNRGKMVDVEA